MKNTLKILGILAFGVVAYLLGKNQAFETEKTISYEASAAAVNTDTQTQSEARREPTAEQESSTPNPSDDLDDESPDLISQSEPINSVEELYPHYFENDFELLARKSDSYVSAVESLTAENGISTWGKSRLNLLKDAVGKRANLMTSNELDCRISTCLLTGYTRDLESLNSTFEEVVETEEWGVHMNYKTLDDGSLVFFIALYD
ncbi:MULTISPECIES: hypothetical protein [Idiomarina]|jgi:hypothetical protein|uniref:hypothetical protein n=1 Tax=Idiomarina TaxID=135575 RepID=UPI000C6591B2|nr:MULTISPECIES: hypothetical protein [Idiomarina]MAO68276.1 hypothetical protein [Idiomarina sp.]MBF81457.1 hypothetical protein [Idiomarina sp.]|tara:strand:+ start:250 stop:861 length:612 start_codon:yes stop_codon:yes gene_type:complete